MIKKETLKKRLLQILYIIGAGCLWMWLMGMHFILFSFFRAIRDFFVFVFTSAEPYQIIITVIIIMIFILQNGNIRKKFGEHMKKIGSGAIVGAAGLAIIFSVVLPLVLAFAVGFGVASYIRKGKTQDTSAAYIVNIGSKRIHKSTCKYVDSMNKDNKRSVQTYETAKNIRDFIPCKECLPEAYYEYYK